MKQAWANIRGIKTIHKVVITIFMIGYLAMVTNVLSDRQKLSQNLLKYGVAECQEAHKGNVSKINECEIQERRERDRQDASYKTDTVLALAVLAIGLFPIWLVSYNTFRVIRSGYREIYNFRAMSNKGKALHILGLIYGSLIIIFCYTYIDYLIISSKIPVTPPAKHMSVSSEEMSVEGIWVEDLPPYEELNLSHLGRTIDNVAITCRKQTMTCDHRQVSVDLDSNHFLNFSGFDSSNVEIWDNERIVSYVYGGCWRNRYTFDLVSEKVLWDNVPVKSPDCLNNTSQRSFTLWDGIDFHSELEWNERSRLIKAILSIIG